MNANSSHIMTRTICSLTFGVCLTLLSTPYAAAHEIEYRSYVVHDYYVHGRTRFFPGWLRRNREFQHWHSHSRYRVKRHMSWHRLYEIYRFERRHRLYSRRLYGKVYRDQGYRTYRTKPKKRKY